MFRVPYTKFLTDSKRRLAGDVLTPLDKLEVRAEDFTDILAEAR